MFTAYDQCWDMERRDMAGWLDFFDSGRVAQRSIRTHVAVHSDRSRDLDSAAADLSTAVVGGKDF